LNYIPYSKWRFFFFFSIFSPCDYRSGSILFASNITLISNLSEDQTINTIEKLIKPVDNSKTYNLNFDLTAHHIKRTSDISHIGILFKNLSRTVDNDYAKQAESIIRLVISISTFFVLVDSALRLLVGCLVGIGCLMIIITSILCLYGYYKCRRRQFRLFAERQTFKFKHDIDAYKWLGQQPSIGSSSPYLIQSTSIWLIICLELYTEIIMKDFTLIVICIYMPSAISRIELMLLECIYTLFEYTYVESTTIIHPFFFLRMSSEFHC
jgi:hypothetical protein